MLELRPTCENCNKALPPDSLEAWWAPTRWVDAGEASILLTNGVSTFSETERRPGQYIVNLGSVEGVDTFALETKAFDGKT